MLSFMLELWKYENEIENFFSLKFFNEIAIATQLHMKHAETDKSEIKTI